MKWLLAILRALGLAARSYKDVQASGSDIDKAAAAADAASKIADQLSSDTPKK